MNDNRDMTMELPEEKLIQEVKARPALYDKELAEYAQMNKRLMLWEEVAKAVDIDVDTCRNRWRSLRDAFLKNYRAVKDFPNGTASRRKKMWSYFDLMFFLAPYVEQDEAKDFATKCIETVEQPCSSNDVMEPESQIPIFIESSYSLSPDCSTADVPDNLELQNSSVEETCCNLGDAQSAEYDSKEVPKKQKQSDEAYKKFLLNLEHAKETELSIEKLISNIKHRPLLYAKGLTDNRKHPNRLALWKEVADATSLDVVSCRKRWRSLRDVFNKNYRSLMEYPPQKKKKMWPYFQKMYFLAPHLEDKETFQYAATKYSHLWQNTAQELSLSDQNLNAFPPESGDTSNTFPQGSDDSSEIIEVHATDEDTSDELNPNLRLYDASSFILFPNKCANAFSEVSTKLIAEVKVRPELYIRGSGGTYQQNKRLHLWDEVASAVGEDVAACMKRWKLLRDAFIKSHRIVERLPNKSDETKKKVWPHYNEFLFLIPYITHQGAIDNETKHLDQLVSNDTSETPQNPNSQLANTNAFIVSLSNAGEILPLSDDSTKQSELQIEHNNTSEILVSSMKTENNSTLLNDTPKQKESEIQFQNLHTCSVSLRKLPENVSLLSGDTSETSQSQPQLNEVKLFTPDFCKNTTENTVTVSKDIAGLHTMIDSMYTVSITSQNISTIDHESFQSRPESVISQINEHSNGLSSNEHSNGLSSNERNNGLSSNEHNNGLSSNEHNNGLSSNECNNGLSSNECYNGFSSNECYNGFSSNERYNGFSSNERNNGFSSNERNNGFSANEHNNGFSANEYYSNFGNTYSRGTYRKSVKRKLKDVTEPVLYGADPDVHFLLSLAPCLKRMSPRQNTLARIKMQQVLFDVEFNEMSRHATYRPQSFAQLAHITSSSDSFYTPYMPYTDR